MNNFTVEVEEHVSYKVEVYYSISELLKRIRELQDGNVSFVATNDNQQGFKITFVEFEY